uniref:Uncharacterized protein n=1 Tax=Plectus sambesii TaxID=2011161 RepID=A0A914WHD8_9BILA
MSGLQRVGRFAIMKKEANDESWPIQAYPCGAISLVKGNMRGAGGGNRISALSFRPSFADLKRRGDGCESRSTGQLRCVTTDGCREDWIVNGSMASEFDDD